MALAYPDAHCELDFETPYQLLVATILSAQSTDRRVNGVTPRLFARYPDPAAMAGAAVAEVEDIIRPVGFFHNKALALVKGARAIVDDFDGVVPRTLPELVKLPGVGRKTANVVLGDAFNVPGITPDTHVIRLANRFGWVSSTNPDVVERAVGALFEPSQWVILSHRMIWHGRRCCHARNPACGACVLAEVCPSYGAGETDPARAAGMIREPRG